MRDWASPLSSPDTRWHGCSLRAFALCPLLSPAVPVSASLHFHPRAHTGTVVVGTDEARLGTGFSRIRYATVRWHHSCSFGQAPRRVSDSARMAAVSFRHFFVLQSFAPFIFRTESLDLPPLRRSALPHMHHPHPAGGRPGSSSRIRTHRRSHLQYNCGGRAYVGAARLGEGGCDGQPVKE